MMAPTPLKQTPSQTVGPYFAYGLTPEQYRYDFPSLFSERLAEPHCAGQHILITGQVFDGQGAPVADALLEFLQADANGAYVRDAATARQTGFKGFARIGTGGTGSTGTAAEMHYLLHTIKPGRISANDAPHIDLIVLMRGLLLHAYTRLYFDDDAANIGDELLASVPEARRASLLARLQPSDSTHGLPLYRFDIHMQGPHETVFFDL
jgi:protocatechuate 3,4-dioxygenase alpha subunit